MNVPMIRVDICAYIVAIVVLIIVLLLTSLGAKYEITKLQGEVTTLRANLDNSLILKMNPKNNESKE